MCVSPLQTRSARDHVLIQMIQEVCRTVLSVMEKRTVQIELFEHDIRAKCS